VKGGNSPILGPEVKDKVQKVKRNAHQEVEIIWNGKILGNSNVRVDPCERTRESSLLTQERKKGNGKREPKERPIKSSHKEKRS